MAYIASHEWAVSSDQRPGCLTGAFSLLGKLAKAQPSLGQSGAKRRSGTGAIHLSLAGLISSGMAGATAQSAAATSGRSNAWKTRRRGVEWRIRWLEHRLQELHHQQRRYETRLAKLQDAAGATSGAAEPAAQQTAQVRPPLMTML